MDAKRIRVGMLLKMGLAFLAVAGRLEAGGLAGAGKSILEKQVLSETYQVYEVKIRKDGDLSYRALPHDKERPLTWSEGDEDWRLLKTCKDKDEAQKHVVELEAKNLVWGVYEIRPGAEAKTCVDPVMDVKRAPRNAPRTWKRANGEEWILLKKFDKEEKARDYLAKKKGMKEENKEEKTPQSKGKRGKDKDRETGGFFE